MQTGSNYTVRIAREITEGTAALVGATALQLRSADSPGLKLARARIKSNTRRPDGLKDMDRLGYKTVAGSYNFDLTIGGVTDMLFEALMRGTWIASSALTTATGAGACVNLTANATNQITRTGTGSFITDGWKEGDVARMTLYGTAGDNSINLPVIGVAGLILTFAGTPLTVGAASVVAVLTRMKKLITSTPPVLYSHTIEQYEVDNDLSRLFLGCKCIGMKITLKPGQMVMYTATFLGMNRTLLVTGTSPWFTSPTLTTGVGLITDQSALWVNGAVAALVTGFDLNFSLVANGDAVIGNFVTPSIFTNDLTVDGTFTFLRTSFANEILYDAETEISAGILFVEPGVAPVGSLNLWLPRIKLADLDAPPGGDGPMHETAPFIVAPAPVNGTATSDATNLVVSSSAP